MVGAGLKPAPTTYKMVLSKILKWNDAYIKRKKLEKENRLKLNSKDPDFLLREATGQKDAGILEYAILFLRKKGIDFCRIGKIAGQLLLPQDFLLFQRHYI